MERLLLEINSLRTFIVKKLNTLYLLLADKQGKNDIISATRISGRLAESNMPASFTTNNIDEATIDSAKIYATNRTNHTGLQTANTISDFDTTVNAIIDFLKGNPNGLAPLGADNKIPQIHLPAITIGETFTVSSQSQMLALVAQNNDVAIRSDIGNRRFLLTGGNATLLSNWAEIGGAGNIVSINGRTGAVVISKSDVSLDNVPNVDATNPANIAQSTDYRFTSDVEKNSWNNKFGVLEVGDRQWLSTTNKTTIVAAINELVTLLGQKATASTATKRQVIDLLDRSTNYNLDITNFDETDLYLNLKANITINIVGAAQGKKIYIRAVQGTPGNFTLDITPSVTYPSSVIMNTVAGKVNTYGIVCASNTVLDGNWTKYQ